MSPTAWVIMLVIAGIIWGGFGLLLTLALRREAAKTGE